MAWLQEQIERAKATERKLRRAYGAKVWAAKVAIIKAKYANSRHDQ